MNILQILAASAIVSLSAGLPALAEDAMAPATDAMAPTKMLSDADAELCLTQAAAITFPEAMTAATVACNGMHQGMDVIGAIRSLGMDEKMEANPMAPNAMGGGAMNSDAMGGAMAPQQ